MEFRLPELGEGIADATVVNIAVKVGDQVTSGQTLLEVETDKAAMPIPATFDGVVVEVRIKSGDKIKIGQPILAFSTPAAQKTKPTSPAPKAAPAASPAAPKKATSAAPAKSTPQPPAERVEFKLPALGEGIDGGTVVSVAVKQGDPIAKEQEIFTIETDKASVPIPSPVDGVIAELHVKAGAKYRWARRRCYRDDFRDCTAIQASCGRCRNGGGRCRCNRHENGDYRRRPLALTTAMRATGSASNLFRRGRRLGAWPENLASNCTK